MRKFSAKIGVTALFALALFALSISQAFAPLGGGGGGGGGQGPPQVDCDAGESIQAALDQAKNGDTINVSGTCNERVTIILDNLTLVGDGTAIIDGTGVGGGLPLLLVHASNITIRDITVQDSPGHGIQIRRSGSAVIQGTTVRNNARNGIAVVRSGFAIIGPEAGNHDNPGTPGSVGNSISGNGSNGVRVRLSAGAFIFHNNIFGNGSSGISLSEGASADIAGNNITGNTRRGINLLTNASVQLSDSFTHGEANLINGNDVGIRCRTGGALRGIAPDFTGGNTTSDTDIGGNCVESIPSFP